MNGDLLFVNIPFVCECFTLIPKHIAFPLFFWRNLLQFPKFEESLTVSTCLSIIACFTCIYFRYFQYDLTSRDISLLTGNIFCLTELHGDSDVYWYTCQFLFSSTCKHKFVFLLPFVDVFNVCLIALTMWAAVVTVHQTAAEQKYRFWNRRSLKGLYRLPVLPWSPPFGSSCIWSSRSCLLSFYHLLYIFCSCSTCS